MQKKQDKLINLVIKFVFCELFACIFMTAVANSIIVNVTPAAIIFSTALSTLVFYIISCFKRIYKIFSIVVFSVIGVGIIVSVLLIILGVLPTLGDLFQMLMDRALSTEKLTEAQQMGVAYGIAVAISFLSVFFISHKINLVVLAASTFVFYGFQFASTKNRASMGAFAALIYVLVVLAIYKMFEHFEAKSGTGFGYKRFAVFGIAAVMCVCVAAASVISPFEENAFSRRFSLERFSNDSFYENGVGSYYLAWSGVGYDDAYLGGQRGALNFDSALKITSAKPTYIVGSYNDTYTGHSWELSLSCITGKTRYHDKGEDPYEASKLPMNTALKMAAFDKAGIEYTENPITLTYQGDMYFRTLFTTNGLTFIENPHKRTIWYDPCENMYTNQYMRKRFDYSFDSYYFDIQSQLAYLRSEAYTGENPDNKKIKDAELDVYEKAIYSRYLSKPENVPERITALTNKIIADAKAETRVDKVWSIMEYLYQFKYVYETDEVPEGVDFVDNFLFNEKQGYSTYFASALALMCREAGIPSRYVKGFAPLADAGEDKIIGNNNAHAWVEVYFDGFGWVTFDPSPYFAEKFYDISMSEFREKETLFDNAGEEIDPAYDQEEEDSEGEITHNEKEKSGLFSSEFVVFGVTFNVGVVVIICSSILGVIIIWLVINLVIKRRKRQMARMYRFENRQFVYTAWYEIKRLAKYDGKEVEPNETPVLFLARLGKEYENEIIPASAESFNKLLYSRRAEITAEDRAYAAAAYDIINKSVMARHKKFAFNFARYIMHII